VINTPDAAQPSPMLKSEERAFAWSRLRSTMIVTALSTTPIRADRQNVLIDS
jgi:hypothetical protein